MLFAKDFKTALTVLVASVGLLGGYGVAHADVQLGTASEGDSFNPTIFAAEAYTTREGPTHDGEMPYGSATLPGDTGMRIHADNMDIALLDGERYFIRLDLIGGFVFVLNSDTPWTLEWDDGGTDRTDRPMRVRDGVRGDTSGIWSFRVDDGATAGNTDDVIGGQVAAGDWRLQYERLDIRSVELIADRDRTEEMEFEVRLRLYDNLAEARRAQDDDAMSDRDTIHDKTGVLFKYVPTVSASVTAPKELTASVASNFRRFLPMGGATATGGDLATANVTVKTMEGTTPILNPEDGSLITAGDVLEDVTFTLTGSFTHSQPFSFGEFSLGGAAMTRYDADDEEIEAADAAKAEGKEMTVSVKGTVDAAGAHPVAVDVTSNNVESATNPYSVIGQGTYMLAWDIDQKNPEDDDETGDDPSGGMGAAGEIMRDGSTVYLAYLSTAAGATRTLNDDVGNITQTWNQRLLITNHSNISADVVLSGYSAGEDVTVACQEGGADAMWTCGDNGEVMTTIGADEQIVLRVQDVLMITGANRTAAILTIAADDSQVSVATTHVTLPLGTTDTVVYWPLGG